MNFCSFLQQEVETPGRSRAGDIGRHALVETLDALLLEDGLEGVSEAVVRGAGLFDLAVIDCKSENEAIEF